jgi:hypothetical protein
MIQSVLPHPPLNDVEEINRIKKLSEYVARNGPEFEEKVRLKEVGNSAFSFLTASENPAGIYSSMCVSIYTHLHIYIFTHIYTYVNKYIYMHKYTYI